MCYDQCVSRIAQGKPRLDVRDLEIVLAVAGAGSTARAAGVLHLTQSAVSRALLGAEEKVGVRLFERTARGLAPTAAGQRLVAGAGALLAQLAALEASVVAPAKALRIKLVCECYTAYRWLPTALAALQRASPGLDVTLAVEHTADPAPALASGEVDVALLTTARAAAPIREEPLFEDEIVFLVGASHPLAGRATLTRRDLREHTLVTSHTPPAEARWFASRVFGRSRPKLRFLRFPLTEAIVDAVRAGLGIGIMSEWIASTYLGAGDVVVKRLDAGPLARPWRIAFRPEAELAARRLAAVLAGAPPRVHHLTPRRAPRAAAHASAPLAATTR